MANQHPLYDLQHYLNNPQEFQQSDQPSKTTGRYYWTHYLRKGFGGFTDECAVPDIETWHQFQCNPSGGGRGGGFSARGGRGGGGRGRGGYPQPAPMAPAPAPYAYQSQPAPPHVQAYGQPTTAPAPDFSAARKRPLDDAPVQPAKYQAIATPQQQTQSINLNTTNEYLKRVEAATTHIAKCMSQLVYLNAEAGGYDPHALEATGDFVRVARSDIEPEVESTE